MALCSENWITVVGLHGILRSMNDYSRGWWVLGWRADVYYDTFINLFAASVPQVPSVTATGTTRSEALALLREILAEEVGPNPATCDDPN